MGDYVASKLCFEDGENAVYMIDTKDYSGFVVFVFDNGRIAKVPLNSYITKTNRKKLINAYCEKYELHTVLYLKDDCDLELRSTNNRMLIVNTASVPLKATKNNGGIAVMTQKKGQRIYTVKVYVKGTYENEHRYRTKNLPAAGSIIQNTAGKQEKMDI